MTTKNLDRYTLDQLEPFAKEWLRRKRSEQKPPTPKVMRPCPHCRKRFGAREMRVHVPQCPKKEKTQ